jgi:hypothetical protein
VTPDGRSVYVTSLFDGAIVSFDRDPTSGTLTPAGCIQDAGRTDCGASQHGLDGARGIAVSPEGGSVYVVSVNDSAIVRFNRELEVAPPPPAPGGGEGASADTNPPETTITKGPPDKTKKKTATFEFTGTDARAVSGFQCKLDARPFVACTSPYTVKVKKGKHTFQVQAIDQAGNVDGSPATDTWKRKKKRKR